MNTKTEMCDTGIELSREFCALNNIPMPKIRRLSPDERLHHLATCAFYRPTTIHIMVDKCASRGYGGPAWSWPGYCVDRTPYGVIQHELGHHIDHTFSSPARNIEDVETLFSWKIYEASKEAPMTGYLGKYTDYKKCHFYMEWFAENFRLFVTNPDLSLRLRPKFYQALENRNIKSLPLGDWESRLKALGATERIIEQARKKITEVGAHYQQEELVA